MKNSLIYIFGEIVAKAIPFLLIPYLTRSLSVDGFGVLSFYLSIIPFLALLLGLNQWQALARYYHRYGQRAINLIVVSGHIYTLLFSVLIAGGLYFFLGLEKQFYLILACAVLQNIFTMHMALLQMDRQSILYALLQIVTGLFSVVITLLVFEYSGKTPENRLLSMALSSLIVVLLSTALFFYRNNRKVFFL
ncbi:hypothetical protein V757_03110 [Pelistega indica]|uniref:Polysaccharide biosynthesis protein C-terminal domain-containing protein n=1 Tax=Pelistega indica TaxID=1414851 RepID=V8G963_9BURK|nr:oligosaccharide flippase family protein [Pelistega indica]ETD72651.1 hypothetical protein V757_03110 [Pelistega indica]